MPDLSRRSRLPEWMDGDDVSQAEYSACMADLAQVNTLTLARRPTIAFIDRAIRNMPADRVLTVVDVGFGAGDMLRALSRLAKRRGRHLRLIGIDLNPRSEPMARGITPPAMGIEYRTGDLFAWAAEEPIDIIISSLVTHHMDDTEIERFLRFMEERATLGWFINDLHRHALPYYFFRLFSAAMCWHPFVRHDGPLSIARAFTHADWVALIAKSGVGNVASIRWWFPFRWCVGRWRL